MAITDSVVPGYPAFHGSTWEQPNNQYPAAHVDSVSQSVIPNSSFSYEGPNGTMAFFEGRRELVPKPVAADLQGRGLVVYG